MTEERRRRVRKLARVALAIMDLGLTKDQAGQYLDMLVRQLWTPILAERISYVNEALREVEYWTNVAEIKSLYARIPDYSEAPNYSATEP